MKNNSSIGVFDSGVGGLSILRELKHLLPNENFVFFADQAHVPYGEKSKEELCDLGCRIMDYFIKEHEVKMVVIACNTSTCNSIKDLRTKYSLPIVGTVPAIKSASEMTKTGTLALIATPSTSKSIMVRELIKENCTGKNIFNIGCGGLEDLVEKGNLGTPEVYKLLRKYLQKVQESTADHLVLGCTHYPFLKEDIEKILGPNIKLIDSGLAIAKRTQALLKSYGLESKQKDRGETIYFTNSDPEKFSKVANSLLALLEDNIEARRIEI